MTLEVAAAGAFAGDDVMLPPNSSIFAQARRWHRLHGFIRNVITLKLGLHNHGLLGVRQTAVNPKKPNGEKVVEWHPGIRVLKDMDAERIGKWKAANAEEIGRVASVVMMVKYSTLWPRVSPPLQRLFVLRKLA